MTSGRVPPSRNVVVTGAIGSGKSTAVARALEILGEIPGEAPTIGGLRTGPISEGGSKVGSYLEAASGQRATFAHLGFSRDVAFGPWGVDLEVFSGLGARAVEEARGRDLVVLDELGIMEVSVDPFAEAVAGAFGSPSAVLAVIQERALDLWLERLEGAEIAAILTVTERNRDDLPERIAAILRDPPADPA